MAQIDASLQTDVVVIGAGIAGGIVALQLADAGVSVLLLTRSETPEDSNTLWAQGGIIYRGETDSPAILAEDILRAGAFHSEPKAVQLLAEEGPPLVHSLLIERIGVPFDRLPSGDLAIIREAAHSQPRIIHSADATGYAIEITLMKRLQEHPKITVMAGYTAIDLLTPSHHSRRRLEVYGSLRCVGLYAFEQASGRVLRILAKKTVLATGGLGQLYLRTTNPPGSRGDGLAMAARAQARLVNCEFVQFHPTIFFKEGAPHFLISEAVRGAGAKLLSPEGSAFMQEYSPEWKDLAPRDVVARSIHREMLRSNRSHVFLDLRSALSASAILERFPTIAAACLRWGVDITKDLIPVVPGAHYLCGGVLVDPSARSTIQDLYAVGEVSCTGVHGANRLASTSLLEGLVWGDRAAKDILASLSQTSLYPLDQIPPWEDSGETAPDPALITQDMHTIQAIMWNYVGLVRTTPRLERALRELQHLETEIERFYRVSFLTDALIGLRNSVHAALLVTRAAWSNKQSIGCHYRE